MPPPKKAEPPHVLEFATNSLRNTTISVDNDVHFYEVVTRFWHPETTKIFKLDPESRQLNLIAEIDRLKSKRPRIRFGGEQGRWIEEDEFLRWDEKKREAVFTGAQGVEYRWKSHHRRLQLVRATDGDNTPVADFHAHRRHFMVWRMSRHAYLEVKPEATEALDSLIMSYLLVQRRRRDSRPALRIERS